MNIIYMRFFLLRISIVLLTILLTSNSFSNTNIDSHDNIINKVSKKEKIIVLNKLVHQNKVSNPEKTLKYAFEALKLAESIASIRVNISIVNSAAESKFGEDSRFKFILPSN